VPNSVLKVFELNALRDLLSPSRLTHVVDIGANPLDAGEPPYLPMLNANLCHVTGFEPQQERTRRFRRCGSVAKEDVTSNNSGGGQAATLWGLLR
jgi:hypothetical protein